MRAVYNSLFSTGPGILCLGVDTSVRPCAHLSTPLGAFHNLQDSSRLEVDNVGNLGHHTEDRALHIFVQLLSVGEDVESISSVVVVGLEGEVFRSESGNVNPVSCSAISHHGFHGLYIRDIGVSSKVEPELNVEQPGVFQVALNWRHSFSADGPR